MNAKRIESVTADFASSRIFFRFIGEPPVPSHSDARSLRLLASPRSLFKHLLGFGQQRRVEIENFFDGVFQLHAIQWIDVEIDRKSTRLNSSHERIFRMP